MSSWVTDREFVIPFPKSFLKDLLFQVCNSALQDIPDNLHTALPVRFSDTFTLSEAIT